MPAKHSARSIQRAAIASHVLRSALSVPQLNAPATGRSRRAGALISVRDGVRSLNAARDQGRAVRSDSGEHDGYRGGTAVRTYARARLAARP